MFGWEVCNEMRKLCNEMVMRKLCNENGVWISLRCNEKNRMWNYKKGYVMIVVGWNKYMVFLNCIGVELIIDNGNR